GVGVGGPGCSMNRQPCGGVGGVGAGPPQGWLTSQGAPTGPAPCGTRALGARSHGMAASSVEEVKARVDLVDLIGSTVALQRAGRGFRALCPFHGEKTPSFYVFPAPQTWRRFGCGSGGVALSSVAQRDTLA